MGINVKNWGRAKNLVFITPFAFAGQAFACTAPPPIQYQQISELIARNKHIVLAKVEGMRIVNNDKVSYRFKTLENLKGDNKTNFQLVGITEDSPNTNSFNNHRNNEFWQDTGGRLYTSADCQIYPSFTVGSTYLLFLDKPYHVKSFEKIENIRSKNRDKWFSYVKNKILDE